MASLDSLDALLEAELKDLYDAEKQLTKALPKLAKKAASSDLQDAFEQHLQQTEEHISRLEQIFELLEMPARGKKCVGMQNLLKEGDEMIGDAEDDATRDAVMVAAAQKVEHYEIASYGTVRTWANLLGKTDVAAMLEDTLEEEKETDLRLTTIAESMVNQRAADGEQEEQEEDDADAAPVRSRKASTRRGPMQQAAERSRRARRQQR
jgi:ferritin-like metal-binding protein YciE